MEHKTCQNCKKDFTIESEDFSFYEKMKVPVPTFCPQCRMIRRMSWRNHRGLHRRSCDLCGKSFISMYNPGVAFPVYCNLCWYGDGWDPFSYGRDVDWNRPFLEQWLELWNAVPKYARVTVGSVQNSDFGNGILRVKDCYLTYSTADSENIAYSESIDKSKNLVDCHNCISCDSSYQVQGSRLVSCQYLAQSRDCISCMFCFDCVNCQDCFMSSNLRNKRYVFRNQQLTREEYIQAIEGERLAERNSREARVEEWKMLMESAIHLYSSITNSTDSTGNFIQNAKNIKECFMMHEAEDCRYCIRAFGVKDAYDLYGLGDSQQMYETVACTSGSSLVRFSINTEASYDVLYSALCVNANHIFGSIGIRKNSYVILNKQYEKEEYEQMVEKIIAHMHDVPYVDAHGRTYRYGEFFPSELSPFGYNETIAHDNFPKDKKTAEAEGYAWHEPEDRAYQPTMTSESLPKTIGETDDGILKEIIACAHAGSDCNQQCTKAFRITQDELGFYRRMNIPIPSQCPNCRHHERLSVVMLPYMLWNRRCMCEKQGHGHAESCVARFETSYAPERPELVYCESCYQKEVL